MPPEEIGSAYLRIRADTRMFAEEVRSGVGSAVRGEHPQVNVGTHVDQAKATQNIKTGVGGAVKNALGYIGGLYATAKAFEFAKGAIQDAAQVQKSMELVRNEYGRSASFVNSFATNQAASVGISTAASTQFAAGLGRVAANLHISQGEASVMSVNLQNLAGHFAEVTGADPSPILQKLQLALLGNTRGLRAMGIASDSTTLKLEAVKLGFLQSGVGAAQLKLDQEAVTAAQDAYTKAVDRYKRGSPQALQANVALGKSHQAVAADLAKVTGTLTPAQKAQTIYNVAMESAGRLATQAQAHTGDYQTQLVLLRAEFANLQEELGRALLPVMQDVIHATMATVNWFREHSTVAKILGATVAGLAGAFIVVKGAMFAWSAATTIWTGVQWAANAAMIAMNTILDANPIVLVTVAIAALAIGLYELYQHSATVRDIVHSVWSEMRALALPVLSAVRAAISGFVSVTGRLWSQWGGAIESVTRGAIGFVVRYVRDYLHIVENVFALFGDLLHGRWGRLWGDVRNIVSSSLTLIEHVIGGAVGTLLSLAQRAGIAILEGIWSGVTQLGHDVARFFTSTLPHAITSTASAIYNDALRLGSRIIHGVLDGVKNLGSDLKNAVEGYVGGALSSLNPFSPIEHGAQMYISQPIITGTRQGLADYGTTLQSSIIAPLQTVMIEARKAAVSFITLGTAIRTGTVSGVAGLQTALGSSVISAIQGALAKARAAFGIHSPSNVWATQLGQPLAEGILHGMGGLEQMLVSRVQSAAQAAYGAVGGAGPQGSAAVGYNQRLGYQMMLAAGWPASQWGALQALWTRESGWNANAVNPSSGAAGIPQALGHGHVFNLGDARAQIAWGLEYIRARYGSPAAAWQHELSAGWYQQGGVQPGDPNTHYPAFLRGGEVVFTPEQLGMLARRSLTIGQVVIQGGGSAQGFIDDLDALARSMG